ncbi:hypothetical protein ACE2AJ_17195 [Aquihabitans daechungensis]|uniref:hypothetical protein n=1 Tax=Aquihabitans daechungensis TaxID=1052257 RepID=UPI003BA19E78
MEEQRGKSSRPRAERTRWRWAVAAATVGLLLATTACGSDSEGGSSDDPTTTEAGGSATDESTTTEAEGGDEGEGEGEGEAVEVTITADGLEGLPTELAAGLVDVTVDDQSEEGGAGGDVSFTQVEPGTTEEDFVKGLAAVFEGGPFPDHMLNSAGAIGSGSIILEEGEYIVWSDLAANVDRESTPEDIVTAPLTVGAGNAEAELPETDGEVVATDYNFAVEAPAGGKTLAFRNDSDEQWHHVLIVDFGTNDPKLVEENLPAILEAEGEDLPEGIDGEQINFEFAASSVFGPGSAGTFDAELEEGNTYAALCFISDVGGGAPHAIQHSMYEVFQGEAA